MCIGVWKEECMCALSQTECRVESCTCTRKYSWYEDEWQRVHRGKSATDFLSIGRNRWCCVLKNDVNW